VGIDLSSPEPLGSGALPDRLPLFLDLRGRKVVVVGGGEVGTRRAQNLLEAGARVTVVAPEVTDTLVEAAQREGGQLTWLARPFQSADLAHCWLVHIATGDRATDLVIAAAAEAAGVWSVVASDHLQSAGWFAATTEPVDGVRVAVSASGDPGRAMQVRDDIAEGLRDGTLLGPRRRVRGTPGRVWLVGSGPGDPDLLTVRARRVLRLADVVLTDHLIAAAILKSLAPGVEVIDVGKRPGAHAMPQEQINALVIEHARKGRFVVRLKGGDPFVFGRGGEEALDCINAGIAVEVVPGISSAIAVPASAGIPVTHRGVADSFIVVSGHLGWSSIAAHVGAPDPSRTIVILMGMRALGDIARGLMDTGYAAKTPTAVIAQGWTGQQHSVVASLADVDDRVRAEGLTAPAIIVIGEVVALRELLGEVGSASVTAQHTQDPSRA